MHFNLYKSTAELYVLINDTMVRDAWSFLSQENQNAWFLKRY